MVKGPLPLVSQHLHRSFHSILHCNQWWLVALGSRPVLVLVGRREQMGRKWISRRGAGRRKNQQLSQISPARRPRSRRVYTTVQAAPIIHLLHSVGVLGRHRSTNSWLRWEAPHTRPNMLANLEPTRAEQEVVLQHTRSNFRQTASSLCSKTDFRLWRWIYSRLWLLAACGWFSVLNAGERREHKARRVWSKNWSAVPRNSKITSEYDWRIIPRGS